MILFGQWSIDENGKVTFEKCPFVEELILKIRRAAIFSRFQFQPSNQRVFFNYDSTFLIYGQFFTKRSFRFLKDCVLTEL